MRRPPVLATVPMTRCYWISTARTGAAWTFARAASGGSNSAVIILTGRSTRSPRHRRPQHAGPIDIGQAPPPPQPPPHATNHPPTPPPTPFDERAFRALSRPSRAAWRQSQSVVAARPASRSIWRALHQCGGREVRFDRAANGRSGTVCWFPPPHTPNAIIAQIRDRDSLL